MTSHSLHLVSGPLTCMHSAVSFGSTRKTLLPNRSQVLREAVTVSYTRLMAQLSEWIDGRCSINTSHGKDVKGIKVNMLRLMYAIMK